MADQIKKNYGDEIDDQLNYLANSMKDWEQSEHALSEAAAMLSGISRNNQDGDSFQSLKQGLDDITASLNRMSAAAREDMADVIEQTQRDNDLFDAINIGPVIENTPVNNNHVESGAFGVPNSQPATQPMQEPVTTGGGTNPVPAPEPQPRQEQVSAPVEPKSAAMPEPKEKTISKLKPLDDSTSGMEIEKLAALYKTSPHGKSSSKLPKASKAAKAAKAPKNTVSTDDVFETVVKEEAAPSGDGFRFVVDKQIVENPVEWKIDESLLQAAKAPEAPEAEEPITTTDTAADVPEQTPLAASAGTESSSALLSEEPTSPAESEGMLNFEPSAAPEEIMSQLTPETQSAPEETMSQLTPEPQSAPEEMMSRLTPESQSEPEEMMSQLAPEPQSEPEEATNEPAVSEPEEAPSESVSGEEMTFTNDMFDLGIDLSDEPDYSDENINLDVFSGSIEDAEKYNAPDNSLDLDAAEAEQSAKNNVQDDLSNLVAAALNDLASNSGNAHAVEENSKENELDVPTTALESEAEDTGAAAPEEDEENYDDVPTVSNLEQELKEQEIEKKIKQSEESRQNNEAGFAYALNDVEQAAADETEEELDESAGERVFAQHLVRTDSEGEERTYYRLILR